MQLRWLYVDFNSYFASCEQQAEPSLRGKPVAVLPVMTEFTSIIAASYEAKKLGIKTNTSVREAKQLCPNIKFVLARHDVYVDYHHKLIKQIENNIPVSKVWSIDEMACRMMDNEIPCAEKIALGIKKSIAANVGEYLTCSIGISTNRYLAKLATEMQKPNGLVTLHLAEVAEKIKNFPMRGFPGIGYNMEARLNKHQIFTAGQLWNLSPKEMRRIWGGVPGEDFWHHLHGYEVEEKGTKKTTIGHSHMLAPELRPNAQAKIVAYRLMAKAASRLRRVEYYASHVDLSVRGEKDERENYSIKIPPTCDTYNLLHALEELWSCTKLKTLRKVSITLHGLTAANHSQTEMFEMPDDVKKKEKLSRAVDILNAKMGRDSVNWGVMPNAAKSFSGTKVAFARIPEAEEFYE